MKVENRCKVDIEDGNKGKVNVKDKNRANKGKIDRPGIVASENSVIIEEENKKDAEKPGRLDQTMAEDLVVENLAAKDLIAKNLLVEDPGRANVENGCKEDTKKAARLGMTWKDLAIKKQVVEDLVAKDLTVMIEQRLAS